MSSYVSSKEIVKSRTMAQKPVSLLILAVGGGEGDNEREGLAHDGMCTYSAPAAVGWHVAKAELCKA